ncbi:hypothetical protein [Bacteroides sedimenti]|uniref:Uncharacterized protein n=1 Tax=Bacteroides sedimenti TaxID=2136147 RepID=A0ABM8I9C5_9BACE
MKKRLRKKLHVGEYKYRKGFCVYLPVTKENVTDHLENMSQIAKDNNLLFMGFGCDTINFSDESFIKKPIPLEIFIFLKSTIAYREDYEDLLIAYFTSPSFGFIRQENLSAAKSAVNELEIEGLEMKGLRFLELVNTTISKRHKKFFKK